MKRYSYDSYNWVMYTIALGMNATALIVTIYLSVESYLNTSSIFVQFPIVLCMGIAGLFLWKLLSMPYAYELDEKDILRCISIIENIDIPISTIHHIVLPPSASRVQIGSIEYTDGKVYINATLKGNDQFVRDLQNRHKGVMVMRSWWP